MKCNDCIAVAGYEESTSKWRYCGGRRESWWVAPLVVVDAERIQERKGGRTRSGQEEVWDNTM